MGRFISPDTLVPDPDNVLDWDRYLFVRGNPIKYTDPSGHAVRSDTDENGCSGQGPACIIEMYGRYDNSGLDDSLEHFVESHPDYVVENDPQIYGKSEEFLVRNAQFRVGADHRMEPYYEKVGDPYELADEWGPNWWKGGTPLGYEFNPNQPGIGPGNVTTDFGLPSLKVDVGSIEGRSVWEMQNYRKVTPLPYGQKSYGPIIKVREDHHWEARTVIKPIKDWIVIKFSWPSGYEKPWYIP